MLDIQKLFWAPKVVVNEVDDYLTEFSLQYLPKWFWHTLWNAIRRLMLSYTLWGAITWLKIKWVPHEYYVLDWVKESIIDVLLNFKKLRFKFDDSLDSEIWVSQKFTWIKKYTSSDLKLPAWIDLISDDDYLFELTDPSLEFNVEFRIEKWYWYYNIEFLRNREKQKESQDVNLLLIDNDFRTVDFVKYEVKEIIEDFSWATKEILKIDIKSRYKKISPKELLVFVWEILASYAKLFIFDDVYIDRTVMLEYEDLKEKKEKEEEQVNIKTMPIDALPLSERTRNALIKNNILYVEDLEKKKKWELLLMKWVWRKAIEEINKALSNIWKLLIV